MFLWHAFLMVLHLSFKIVKRQIIVVMYINLIKNNLSCLEITKVFFGKVIENINFSD
jgi:hypothetical protein